MKGVRLPNGRVVSVPDEATPEQIEAFINSPEIRLRAASELKLPEPPGFWSQLGTSLKNTATGAMDFFDHPLASTFMQVINTTDAIDKRAKDTGRTLNDPTYRADLSRPEKYARAAGNSLAIATGPIGLPVADASDEMLTNPRGGAGSLVGSLLPLALPKVMPTATRDLNRALQRPAAALEGSAQTNALRAAEATPEGLPVAVRAGRAAPSANTEGVVNLKGRAGMSTLRHAPDGSIQSVTTPQAPPGAGQVLKDASMHALNIKAGYAIKTIAALSKTPQWLKASANMQSHVAELLKAGRYAEGAELMANVVGVTRATLDPATQDPRQRYIDHLIGSGSEGAQLTQGHEFPVAPERERLLNQPSRKLTTLLPDGFANANAVQELPSRDLKTKYGLGGLYGAHPDPSQPSGLRYDKNDRANTVVYDTTQAGNAATREHELGHAVWYRDLRDDQRAAFEQRVRATTDDLRARITRDPSALNGIVGQLSANKGEQWTVGLPHAVVSYYLRHGTDLLSNSQPSPDAVVPEVFAELFGQYMTNPSAFARTYPQDYDLMQGIVSSGYRQQNYK